MLQTIIGGLTISTPSARELLLTREFRAPRALVFDCWTIPHLVRKWLTGPDGWTMQRCDIDLVVGGVYRYEWRNSDGYVMGMAGTYLEISAPERIVSDELFDDDWTGGTARSTIVFTEQDGITLYSHTILYSSEAARDAAFRTGMAGGMESGFAKLDAILMTGN